MPSFNYMIASVMVALRLARGDGKAIDDFDISPAGFWRSFSAMLLVAPFSAMLAMTRYDIISGGNLGAVSGAVTPGRFLLIEIIAYVIAWTAFPVLMATFVRYLDCQQNYIRGIVAFNWASVPQNVLYIPVAVASLNGAAVGPLPFFVLIAVLVYGWFVLRNGFGITKGQAMMLVGLDLSIGVMISFWANKLLIA